MSIQKEIEERTRDLDGILTEANEVLARKGAGTAQVLRDIPAEINRITQEGERQAKTVQIRQNGTVRVLPDDGKVLSEVTAEVEVPAPSSQDKTINISANGTATIKPDEGKTLNRVTARVNVPIPPVQIKEVEFRSNGTNTVQPDPGYNLSAVVVRTNVAGSVPAQDKGLTINSNGAYALYPDSGYLMSSAQIKVEVPDGGKPEVAMEEIIEKNGPLTILPPPGKTLSKVSIYTDVRELVEGMTVYERITRSREFRIPVDGTYRITLIGAGGRGGDGGVTESGEYYSGAGGSSGGALQFEKAYREGDILNLTVTREETSTEGYSAAGAEDSIGPTPGKPGFAAAVPISFDGIQAAAGAYGPYYAAGKNGAGFGENAVAQLPVLSLYGGQAVPYQNGANADGKSPIGDSAVGAGGGGGGVFNGSAYGKGAPGGPGVIIIELI